MYPFDTEMELTAGFKGPGMAQTRPPVPAQPKPAAPRDQSQDFLEQLKAMAKAQNVQPNWIVPPAPAPGVPGTAPTPTLPMPAPAPAPAPAAAGLPQGRMANPLMRQMIQTSYPTLNKYQGQVPTPAPGIPGEDLYQADIEDAKLQAQMKQMFPSFDDLLARAPLPPSHLIGSGLPEEFAYRQQNFSDALRAFDASRQAQIATAGLGSDEASKALALTLGHQNQMEQERLRQSGETDRARIGQSTQRDMALERFLAAQPQATADDIKNFIDRMAASRGLMGEERAAVGGVGGVGTVGVPQPGGAPGLPPGTVGTVDPETKLRDAVQRTIDANAKRANPEVLQKAVGTIGMADANLDTILDAMSQDATLMEDPVASKQVIAALHKRHGTGKDTAMRDMQQRMIRYLREAYDMREGDVFPLGKGVKVTHPSSGFFSDKYTVDIPGYGTGSHTAPGSIEAVPLLGAGVRSQTPYSDFGPTLQRGTRDAYRKRADILARMLEQYGTYKP